ncbi:MAG: polyprenyl diphosphate synthase, partial [Chloroflexota bacterium]|nr:polyprenyl diphosphate synthase [Chloroflexota bacterium]
MSIDGVPRHIAIIMDGNGRWARERGLSRQEGHRAGVSNIRRVVEGCVEQGVRYLTVYAFSTENWSRPEQEVSGLISLLGEAIIRETPILHENGVQIRHLGSLEGLPQSQQDAVRAALELTRSNSRLVLSAAYNYGGRAEIIQAVRALIEAGVRSEDVTEERLSEHLYTAGLPDPDLIVRTAGEMRLSNFLIWQAAYAEYWSTPTHWPDFSKEEFYR